MAVGFVGGSVVPRVRHRRERSSAVSMNASSSPARGRESSVRLAAKMAEMLERVPADLRQSCLALPEEAELVDPLERRTKVVCTIGPSTCSHENLLRLAAEGMNLMRLNMSHSDYAFHRSVLDSIRRINADSPFLVGTIADVGSLGMVRLGEFLSAPFLKRGDVFTLTVRHQAEYPEGTSEVSYDGFLEVAEVGDLVQIEDSAELRITSKTETDAVCEVIRGGALKSRAPIAVRGKTYGPRCGEVPEGDLDFVAKERVDFVSLSFVEDAATVESFRSQLRSRGGESMIIAKIESAQSLRNAEEIVRAADAIMIARGDLGAAIAYEKVPLWQERLVNLCRTEGKPVLVSTHFLDSMVSYPTPTRAEVTDIFEAVRQRADALVLTTETASGRFPFKALGAMHSAVRRVESKEREKSHIEPLPPMASHQDGPFSSVGVVAENIANTASILANQRLAKAILVFTQKGLMASLVSRNRPNAPVIAFTVSDAIRERMTLLHGVRPFTMEFDQDPERTIASAFDMLIDRGWIRRGDLVVVVADVLGGQPDAPLAEKRKAFFEFCNGTEAIPFGRVRAALRRMSLKAPDDVEMRLSRGAMKTLSFDDFDEIAKQAKQIVHTVQVRHCP